MCTNITIKYNKGFVTARTNEFGVLINSNIFTMKRNTSQRGFCTEKNKGLEWENKYGFIGIDGSNTISPNLIALDGMNEKGLSVQGLYFPRYAKYQNTDNYDNAITNLTFSNYVLGCFQNVEEVKKGLEKLIICGEGFNGQPLPFHFQVNDKYGGCIVVEIEDKINIYDNKVGVMTNSPSFDFHETNYQNYINLSPYNIDKIDFNGGVLYQTGQGSGQLGLPGDMTPTSRFIRASFNQLCAIKCNTNEDAVDMAFRILNSFDIVPGTCRHKASIEEVNSIGKNNLILADDGSICEMTQLFLAKDLNNFTIYYKDYYNMNVKKIDCSKFDFESDINPIKGKIYDDYCDKYINITNKLI